MTSFQDALYSAPGSPHVGWIVFSQPSHHRDSMTATVALAIDGEEWSIGIDQIGPYVADTPQTFRIRPSHESVAADEGERFRGL